MDITSFFTGTNPFLKYGFLQRAVLAGIFISIACSILGVFLILRRESMIGHGLAHTAFAGVAIGLLVNIFPLGVAIGFAVLTAFLIVRLKGKNGLYGDTGIAIFSSAGFALGIIIASLSQSFNIDLFSYLFGEILAIETIEVWLSIILAVAVVAVVFLNYRRIVYLTFDGEAAAASGIKVKKMDTLLTVITAVTVVLGMKVVGIILVSALVVIPAASGLQIATSFRRTLLFSVCHAVFSVCAGLVFSFYLDIPASGTIVLISFLGFCLVTLFKRRQ